MEGIEAGADDYLVKSFNARELIARVRVNLQLAHLRQELSRERGKAARRDGTQWRLFDTALSHTPDSIYIFDPQGRLTYANHALLQRWRKSFPEVAGKNLLDLGYPTEIAVKAESQMQQVVQERQPIRDEASLVDATGSTHFYDYVFVPVFFRSGDVESVAGSSRDITEFRETNRGLREANSDLQQFAYSASHDLQEPLRIVSIYSQLLQKMYEGQLDAQADKIIKQCVDSAVRMQDLIRDLLTYTRAAAEPIDLRCRVSLNQALDNTLNALQASISETGASVTRTPLPSLRVEAVHLHQIFQNLLGNAMKYRSERTPEIQVNARREQQEWIISVKDNGIDIDPHFQNQIFGLFRRLHNQEGYTGTGLGLAICKKLVERYGGHIWVESELGQGSTFFFSLPAEDPPPEDELEISAHAVWKGTRECSTI